MRSEGTDLSQSMSQVALEDDVQYTNRADLERRAELYEGLIEEYEGKDAEYVARLRLKLSSISRMLRNLERAEEAAREALAYGEREADDEIVALACHKLGMVAQARRELEEAEDWYRRSLEIKERLGDEHLAATTYYELGRVAQERRNFEEAEDWYRRSLEIFERLSDGHLAAQTYGQRGRLAHDRQNFREAGTWSLKAIQGYLETNDPQRAQNARRDFAETFREAPPNVQDDLRQLWIDAGLPEGELDDLLKQIRAEESN